VTVILHGVNEAKAAVDDNVRQMQAATRQATAQVLHLIERATKQRLSQSSHEPGTPTPSQPGDPPSLVTGNLRRSITVTGPDAVTPSTWRGKVGPTAIYGRRQELGDPGGTPLPARPFLLPSFISIQAQIQGIFRRAWTTAILR